MTHMLLQLTAITKTFRQGDVESPVLNDVHLTVERGEYLAIEGPSGSGKSTILSILGLLDRPSTGSYALNGTETTVLGAAECAALRNREIGFIFQDFNLIGDLTAFENIELPLIYRGVRRHERTLLVMDAIERLGIMHCANRHPNVLSGGEQQRVAVARAIVGSPSVLLADEPTGNLDSARGNGVMEILDELSDSGATIILVTHDPRFARRAKRVVTLCDGQLAS